MGGNGQIVVVINSLSINKPEMQQTLKSKHISPSRRTGEDPLSTESGKLPMSRTDTYVPQSMHSHGQRQHSTIAV